ncbi:MAG: choice-of-anchor Q domain-containing protein [Pseudomonadota bacterium]|nr:choice-of-anchor Q domain-containing protein [Pseudomonadota bacterium]
MKSDKINPNNTVYWLPTLISLCLYAPFSSANSALCHSLRTPCIAVVPNAIPLMSPIDKFDEPLMEVMVDTLIDKFDGSCNNGDCSLREAIHVVADGGIIRFALQGTLDLSGLNEQLVIDKNLTLMGNPDSELTLSGGNSTRILFVNTDKSLTLKYINIVNGQGQTGDETFGDGSGIFNQGNLFIEYSTIAHNQGTPDSFGGGIYNKGNLDIRFSTITDNRSLIGGGIYNLGQLNISHSLLSSNQAEAYGGGLENLSTATLINSTLFDNRANDEGGGIDNIEGQLSLSFTTLAANQASFGSGLNNLAGGMAEVTHSIIAANISPVTDQFADCGLEAINSLGFNLTGIGTGCAHDGIGDQTIDADKVFTEVLGDLSDEGGPTLTLPLLPNSPAIDAGDPSGTPTAPFDQRGPGFPRVINDISDIGAFEFSPPALHITLNALTAEAQANHVLLHWQTASEENHAEFHLWRAQKNPQGHYHNIQWLTQHQAVAAQGERYQMTPYQFEDSNQLIPGQTYYYLLGSVDTQGQLTLHWDFLTSVVVD